MVILSLIVGEGREVTARLCALKELGLYRKWEWKVGGELFVNLFPPISLLFCSNGRSVGGIRRI